MSFKINPTNIAICPTSRYTYFMSSEALQKDLIKISARMPRTLLRRLVALYKDKNLSEVLRDLVEKEVVRQKTLKSHMKLYGSFKPEHFDESLL